VVASVSSQGTIAVIVRKGGQAHRVAGQVFIGGMLLLASTGITIAILRAEPPNILGGLLTIYMITTAWLTARHTNGRSGAFDWIALFCALTFAAILARLGIGAMSLPHHSMDGVPAGMSFFLGTVILIAAIGDTRMLMRHSIIGWRRIARHAWRMSFGLFIATGSFFLGQQQVFPARWRGSVALTILGLFPLALLIYWAIRIRFTNKFKAQPRPALAPTAA
jgi:hypothetical protein